MATTVLSQRALGRATLARQMLLARDGASPEVALGRLLAIQAQWPKPPFVALWSRLASFRREDLLRLVEGREAVRGTLMRGTLHLARAPDFARFRPCLQPMMDATIQKVLKQRAVALDLGALLAQARAHLGERPRTFGELRDLLVSAAGGGDERAMGYAVRLTLPLVQVPADGELWGWPSDAAFADAAAWIDRPIAAHEASLPDLVLRYLAALGPATLKEIQTWTGIDGLREVVDTLRPRLVTFVDDRKREHFDLPDAPRPDEDTPAPVRFLPEFDNVVVAHGDRRRFVPEANRASVFLPGLRVAPTVLVDGRVAGVWKVSRKKATATLTVEPFATVTKKTRAELEAEGDALLRFVEADAKAREVHVARREG